MCSFVCFVPERLTPTTLHYFYFLIFFIPLAILDLLEYIINGFAQFFAHSESEIRNKIHTPWYSLGTGWIFKQKLKNKSL